MKNTIKSPPFQFWCVETPVQLLWKLSAIDCFLRQVCFVNFVVKDLDEARAF